MGQGGWTMPDNSITLPPGAGPEDPRIVIGPDIPASIATFNALGTTWTTVAAYVEWLDENRFYFTAIADDDNSLELGRFQGANDEFTAGDPQLVYDAQIMSQTVAADMKIVRYLLGANVLSSNDQQNEIHFQEGLVTTMDNTRWRNDGMEWARGFREVTSAASNTAGIGAEAVVATIAGHTWRNGRAYELILGGRARAGSAGMIAFQIRRTNLAGAVLGVFGEIEVVTINRDLNVNGWRVILGNDTGADLTDTIVLTFAKSAGTGIWVGSATGRRFLEIRDAGDVSEMDHFSPL